MDGAKDTGGLLVALMSKKKPVASSASSDADEPGTLDNEPGDEAHGAAFDAFARAAGIPADRKASAEKALKQFVYACMEGKPEEE